MLGHAPASEHRHNLERSLLLTSYAAAKAAACVPWRGVNMPLVQFADDQTYGFVALGTTYEVAVRQGGVTLRCVADFVTTEDLRLAFIREGEFATCLDEKTLRLGAEPDGPLTCDIECL